MPRPFYTNEKTLSESNIILKLSSLEYRVNDARNFSLYLITLLFTLLMCVSKYKITLLTQDDTLSSILNLFERVYETTKDTLHFAILVMQKEPS